MSSSTVILPLRRTRWFRDADGNITYSKRWDEILQSVINWADQLASGETISSVAYEDHGVTRSSTSNTTTTSTTNVTGGGYFIVTVTLSTSRKLQKIIRFVTTDGPEQTDYRY